MHVCTGRAPGHGRCKRPSAGPLGLGAGELGRGMCVHRRQGPGIQVLLAPKQGTVLVPRCRLLPIRQPRDLQGTRSPTGEVVLARVQSEGLEGTALAWGSPLPSGHPRPGPPCMAAAREQERGFVAGAGVYKSLFHGGRWAAFFGGEPRSPAPRSQGQALGCCSQGALCPASQVPLCSPGPRSGGAAGAPQDASPGSASGEPGTAPASPRAARCSPPPGRAWL